MYGHQNWTVLINMYSVFPHLWTFAVLFSPSGMVYSQFLPIKILPDFYLFVEAVGSFLAFNIQIWLKDQHQGGGQSCMACHMTASLRCSSWFSNFKLQKFYFFLLARVAIVPRRQTLLIKLTKNFYDLELLFTNSQWVMCFNGGEGIASPQQDICKSVTGKVLNRPQVETWGIGWSWRIFHPGCAKTSLPYWVTW